MNPAQREAITGAVEDVLTNGPSTSSPLRDLAVRVLEVSCSVLAPARRRCGWRWRGDPQG
ncbi:MAG: hypothetical protein R3F36_09780 [Candidatus Competibacteraceae bacterium]